jgi:hypothetical protein
MRNFCGSLAFELEEHSHVGSDSPLPAALLRKLVKTRIAKYATKRSGAAAASARRR